MLKLDNEDDEDEQETVERLKDLSATYQWYQVKEDGSEVIIPDASKAVYEYVYDRPASYS